MAKRPGKQRADKSKDGTRTAGGQFAPGTHGGARGGARVGAGRPNKDVKAAKEALADRLLTPDLLERAIDTLNDAIARGDVDAAKYICDRFWGKPRQAVDMEHTGPVEVIVRYEDQSPRQ